jgi:hypothetical protein
VEETVVDAPPTTVITAPLPGAFASLTGFTLSWNEPVASLTIEITLTQTLFGAVETQTLGPFADTGTHTFTAEDLRAFRQGAPLEVALTRVRLIEQVAGFAAGRIEAAVKVEQDVEPAP